MTRERLLAALSDEDAEARRQAVLAVADSGEVDAGDLLMGALGDTDWRVRKEAARVIARQAEALSLVDPLIEAICQGENVGLRNSALEALRLMGTSVTEALLDTVERVRDTARKFVVEALGNTRDERVVPVLGELCEDEDPNLGASSIEALARVGGSRAEEALRKQLQSPRVFHKMAALDGLDRLGAQVPWEELAPLLDDKMVRRVALRLLGRSASPAAVMPLMAGLTEPSEHVQRNAAQALDQLQSASIDAMHTLRDQIKTIPPQAREGLVSLGGEGDLAARQAAIGLLLLARDPSGVHGVVSLAAAEALPGHIVDSLRSWGADALPYLYDAAEKRSGQERAIALELASDLASLAMEGGGRAGVRSDIRARLVGALGDDDGEVTNTAARLLGVWGDASDAARLVARALTPDTTAARAAGEGLHGLLQREPEAVRAALAGVSLDQVGAAPLIPLVATLDGEGSLERLQTALSAEEPLARRAAVDALAKMGGEGAAEIIAFALADEDADVKVTAATALGRLRDKNGNPVGVEPLLSALETEHAAVQAAAARALGEAGEQRAVEPLRVLLRSEEPFVALSAMEGLRALQDPALADLLVDMLAHTDNEVVKQALHAIAELDMPGRDKRLAKGLGHADWDVRQHAALLLGELSTPDAIAALRSQVAVEIDDMVRATIDAALVHVDGAHAAMEEDAGR